MYVFIGNECSAPQKIENGTYELIDHRGWPLHICHLSYSCQSGFNMLGSGNLYCIRNVWYGSAPTCQGKYVFTIYSFI